MQPLRSNCQGHFEGSCSSKKELAAMHHSPRSLSGHRQFDSLLSLVVSMRAHGSFSPVEKKPVRVQDKWVYDAFFSARVYSNEEIMKLPVRIFGRVVEIRKTNLKSRHRIGRLRWRRSFSSYSQREERECSIHFNLMFNTRT